ncbi:MAG: aspartate/glutamate racemase family protein, partial [Firmicutes bacterium]|nr:aspartate/glutamate racemase family protein [Bacillota bacterium]
MENSFGIIGGMGPMATNLLYEMIIEKTPARADNEHINMVILNHATMPDRTGAIQGTQQERDKVFRLLREDADFMERAGVRGICVPCNTAHFFMHQLETELSVPLISMVREASKEMGQRYPGGKVAILATEGTIQTQIYQPFFIENGLEPYVVPADIQKHVTHLIYDNI